MAPNDYLLYYKRATAYYSMNRHPQALEDFDRVLNLTSNSFEKAHLLKARVHAKDGRFAAARDALKKYKVKDDPEVREVLFGISEAEMAAKKAVQAMKAKLWQACVESSSTALHTASHSLELRQQRANCAIAAGDIEGAVGDLTRLTHLTTPTTTTLMKIFRLAYFLMPYGPSSSTSAMSALKQCLHYDPDSKQCLPAHRLVKSLDKMFKKLDDALDAENWVAVIKLLALDGFAGKLEEALATHMNPVTLDLPRYVPLRSAKKTSPKREHVLRSLCRAYTNTEQFDKGDEYCGELLDMDGLSNDADALVGKGEALLKQEEWDDAVRMFEKAFEASGRSSRDVRDLALFSRF